MVVRLTYSIHVGEGVLSLAVLGQDTRSDLVDLADQVEHRVVRELAESKLALGHVTGVGLTKDGVTVTGDDLTGVEGRPQVVLDGLVAKVVADGRLHLGEPVEHFLVGPVWQISSHIPFTPISVTDFEGQLNLTIRGEDQPDR